MNRTTQLLTMAACGTIGLVAAMSMGGPLDPPAGPITSTYKTLSEIEPRIAVNPTNTPGDSNAVFKIRTHGSYYLTGNVVGVGGKTGIEISDDNVTLDLNGFQVTGVEGSTHGIRVSDTTARTVCIKDGTVNGWGGDGVNTFDTTGSILVDLRVWGNAQNGISAGQSAIIRGCTAQQNGASGFLTGLNATITGCTAQATNGVGFTVGNGSNVTECTSGNNVAEGFNLGTGCTVVSCTSRLNGTDGFVLGYGDTISMCTASFNSRDGVSALMNGIAIRGCTVEANTRDGIRAGADCMILENVCDSNGFGSGDGAAIHTLGIHNRIDRNSATDSDRGIQVDSGHCVILRNTVGDNTTNFVIAAGNLTGTIVTTEAEFNSATSNANVLY